MDYHCERCGEKLRDRAAAVWLELDTRTDTYTAGEVPTEVSQGAFPFGKTCAKRAQAVHDAKTSNVEHQGPRSGPLHGPVGPHTQEK